MWDVCGHSSEPCQFNIYTVEFKGVATIEATASEKVSAPAEHATLLTYQIRTIMQLTC